LPMDRDETVGLAMGIGALHHYQYATKRKQPDSIDVSLTRHKLVTSGSNTKKPVGVVSVIFPDGACLREKKWKRLVANGMINRIGTGCLGTIPTCRRRIKKSSTIRLPAMTRPMVRTKGAACPASYRIMIRTNRTGSKVGHERKRCTNVTHLQHIPYDHGAKKVAIDT
jgi:hypothetical protein